MKANWKRILGVVLVCVVGLVGHQAQLNEDKAKKISAQRLELKHIKYAKKCVQLDQSFEVAKAGPVGSKARVDAVNSYFEEILTAPCVLYLGWEVYLNPFSDSKTAITKSQAIRAGYTHALRLWNQLEPFKMQCADGWLSPSIGKRGACSWHGGVVSFFDTDMNNDIETAFVPSENVRLFKLQHHLALR